MIPLIKNRLYYATCNDGEHGFIFLHLEDADKFYHQKDGTTGKSVQLKPVKETRIWNHTLYFNDFAFELLPETFTLDDFVKDEPFTAHING